MWRLVRRALITLLVLIVLAVLFRGPLYRTTVHYGTTGTRHGIAAHSPAFATWSEAEFDLNELIDVTLDTTAERLHFSTGKVSNAPALLKHGSGANCIGYSALFASLLQEHLARAGRSDDYSVEQVVALLHIGGLNLHDAFNDPFWKDHDVVRITDKASGIVTYYDPTLYDAVGIGRVSGP